eukprot:SAG22_NODE_6659_length_826_cov_0.792297_2_plen_72_part_00
MILCSNNIVAAAAATAAAAAWLNTGGAALRPAGQSCAGERDGWKRDQVFEQVQTQYNLYELYMYAILFRVT